MTELTARQLQALEVIAAHRMTHGVPPAIREVAEAMGVIPESAFHHIRALRKKGMLITGSGRRGARGTLVLTDEGRARLPSYCVHCSKPIYV